MKKLEDIKLDMNDSAAACYEANRECLEDYEFATVTGAMWKGSYEEQFRNKPKPEINQIFGPINRLLGQKERLEMNAVIVPNSEEATEEDSDLLQSRWRNDFQSSYGVEALNNSDQEAFFSGFGAYKIVAKYEDEENPSKDKQVLCVEPVMSAAASVIYGPSLRKDKSDCTQAWELIRTSRKEIEAEYGESVSSVNMQIAWFDWDTDTQKDIYLANYYEVVTKTITTYDIDGYIITSGDGIKDEAGNKVSRSDLKLLLDNNEYTQTRKKVKRVEYALISGDKILKTSSTPFKRVPIIPQYGYYYVINGIEYYFGEVRKRRDPQMFSNCYHSSLMEIMQAPQVEKPEYTPEQIARHAGKRNKADIDGDSFVMSDPIKNLDGSIAHIGPIGKQSPPQIGSGLAAAGQQLQSTLIDMAGTGTSTVPSNAAADAIKQVNDRQDDTFQPLMQNSMFANKAACETWIDAAQVLYFSNPRKIRILAQDGQFSQVDTVQYSTDDEGNYGPYGNSARGKYTVQVKVGESHKSKKEAELDTTLKMLNFADTNTPQGQLLLNQAIISTTGEGGERSRKVANYQIIDNMIALGLDPEPKTEEEKEYVAQKQKQIAEASQNKEPDANTLLAEANLIEKQTAMLAQQNKQAEIQLQAQKVALEAQGKHQKMQSDLAVSSANIDQGQQKIDNEARDKAVKNAISMAELEQKSKQQQDNAIAANLRAIKSSQG